MSSLKGVPSFVWNRLLAGSQGSRSSSASTSTARAHREATTLTDALQALQEEIDALCTSVFAPPGVLRP
ncbi:hypothetical protein [Streptomyces sp. Ac-502]|uniref:hypothetical protein n=1 Tax=Streptomyces sp. Ac-502 TaxID=3342801 RepID=UPI0038621EC4